MDQAQKSRPGGRQDVTVDDTGKLRYRGPAKTTEGEDVDIDITISRVVEVAEEWIEDNKEGEE